MKRCKREGMRGEKRVRGENEKWKNGREGMREIKRVRGEDGR